MNNTRFSLLEFDLTSMKPNPAIVMIAKRGSGKSYIARDLIYHFRHIPGGAVIAPTDRMNSFFKFFFPDLFIHYDISTSIFKRILMRQCIMIDKSKEKKKEGKKVDSRSILIMDDCLSKKKTWSKDENILEILLNGRHYNLTYLLTMQAPIGVDPNLRFNFDYIFLLKEDAFLNYKKLWENYASIFPSLDSFIKVFSKCTKDYKSMVIDNRKPADEISEKIFWFKAIDRQFSFGSKSFKDVHKKYYDPSYIKKKYSKFFDNTKVLKRNKNDIEVDVVLK